MNDKALAKLATKYKEAHEQVKAWEPIKDDMKGKILAELKLRATRLVATNGLRITKVAPTETRYDAAMLKSLVSERLYLRCLKDEIDPAKLSRFVQSGKISVEIAEQCSFEYEKTPYILVNPDQGGSTE